MRKYLLLIIALCLQLAARGQTILSLDDIDLSGLPQPTQAKALRYWFDDDAGSVQTTTQLSGTQTLDVSGLTEGLHTIHYQVMGNDGQAYFIASAFFLKMGTSTDTESPMAKKLMYWFDDETAIQSVDVTGGVQFLDASGLMEGLHTLHYQVLCDNGQMTPAISTMFLRLSVDTGTATAKSLRYWFDESQDATETAITDGVQQLDASWLTEGLHTIHYQIVDSNDALSTPVSSIFLKMYASASSVAKSLRYWYDDDATTVSATSVAGGTQMLDVSALQAGLHTLNYQLVDNEGKLGTPVTRIFFKDFDKVIADGENRVMKYQYWLNSNTTGMQTVMLDNATNPYQLISLLPMQKEPIHSDCFQFEVTDGVPAIYAKNIFHVRFHDAADYFVDGEKPFVDYSVKQEVTEIDWLESGVRATTAKPVENAIKWYCLEAEPGDSVQFKLDRAATIQLFSPSGEEVFSTSGSESVSWGGCHAKKSGTYYLALHDVTAQYGNTVSIDYNHIDKYAVLRQDVAVVGNGGCSTITFEGNGFRDLYAVDLFTAKGDSVHHVYIGHESDATTSVVFDFTDVPLGTYHAKFRFAEEDKVFNNLVTVEEARDIELATTVTYPSTFLRGTSTTYTIKITNKGNMTAYSVPVFTYISSFNDYGISHIKICGLGLPKLFDGIDKSEFTQTELYEFSNLSEFVGDEHYLIKQRIYDDATRDSITIRSGYFFVEIPPLSTTIFSISIVASEPVEVLLSIPDDWNSVMSNNAITNNVLLSRQLTTPKRGRIKDEYCCIQSKIECIGDVIAKTTDLASKIAGFFKVPQAAALSAASCVADAVHDLIMVSGYVLCNDKNTVEDRYWEGIKNSMNAISIPNTVAKCVQRFLPKAKFAEKCKNWSDFSKVFGFYDLIATTGGCIEAFTKPIPGCPPPPPNGGSSNPVNSLDPNDIFGYTASSGSHAVKDGQTDVYYTIEFENDTAFATASAHDIYVTDTLDVTKFDLSTFAPTRVKIGEKSAELTGDKNFVTTIDMRPEINAIAQVEGTYDEKKGIAKWHISSLDPMTMEPTTYVEDGVLPVNTDGRGIGEVWYDIKLKTDLAHGTEINNRAGIVFDNNDVIMTPTWTNVIDRIAPVSHITDVVQQTDSTATVSIEATDNGSGPWRYDVYVQYGSGAYFKTAENVPVDTTATVKIYPGIEHNFYVVATDSAGNMEAKVPECEFTLIVGDAKPTGDVNGDNKVGIGDIIAVTSYMAGLGGGITQEMADVNGDGKVGIGDIIAITDIMAGTAKARPYNKERYKTYFVRRKEQQLDRSKEQ